MPREIGATVSIVEQRPDCSGTLQRRRTALHPISSYAEPAEVSTLAGMRPVALVPGGADGPPSRS